MLQNCILKTLKEMKSVMLSGLLCWWHHCASHCLPCSCLSNNGCFLFHPCKGEACTLTAGQLKNMSKGVRGDKGQQGPPGPSGEQGQRGPAGQKGANGTTGAPGMKGEEGQGTEGPAGPPGPQGQTGGPGVKGNTH